MNTLKNILKMINKINLAELLVCSEKKIQWQKMQNIKRQVSFIKWMSAYRLQQSHWNKYEKGNTFIKSLLFNMLLMKYSFIFLKTYYILLHSSSKNKNVVCHDYRSKNIITVFIQVYDYSAWMPILKPLVHTCATSADFYTEKKGSNFSFFLLDLLRGS